ncbi:recombinase family protein [Kocuria sp. KD4]|uniref:recombinase family protein n=1 Tax=Kocuria sp. KD4 TaxID=2719588 RepID=UPI0014277A65|nr:recombinase family protein [Kocuria sp. KD4]QIR69887.1 recombinase family protein [Kocuria sp. KD4]
MGSLTYLSVMDKNKPSAITPVRALIYARASQDRLKLMRSIGDQVSDCRSWCQPLGWTVVRVLRDADRSASEWRTKDRGGFQEALQLIESGKVDGFVTWEPSRAGRDLEIYLQLRAACQAAGVLYMTQGRVSDFTRSDDSFMLGFEFLRAEADAHTMRERQIRTVRLLAEKGRPHGRIPYGYRRVYDTNTGQLIGQEPDPHTGELVRLMARRIISGTPVRTIANDLQDRGEPTPQKSHDGKITSAWTSMTVKQIMQNPTIAGKRVYRGEIIGDAAWEPLISIEDFARVQRLLSDPSRRVHESGTVTPKSLLSHIAICDCCRHPLRRVLDRPHGDAPRKVRYQCRFRGCYKISISAAPVEEYVVDYVLAWLSRPANAALLIGEDDEWVSQSVGAREHLAKLEARLQEAIDGCANGDVSLGLLSGIEKKLVPMIERARHQLALPIVDRAIRDLVNAEDISIAWNGLAFAEQRRITKALFGVRITPAPRRSAGGAFQHERVVITARAVGAGTVQG